MYDLKSCGKMHFVGMENHQRSMHLHVAENIGCKMTMIDEDMGESSVFGAAQAHRPCCKWVEGGYFSGIILYHQGVLHEARQALQGRARFFLLQDSKNRMSLHTRMYTYPHRCTRVSG